MSEGAEGTKTGVVVLCEVCSSSFCVFNSSICLFSSSFCVFNSSICVFICLLSGSVFFRCSISSFSFSFFCSCTSCLPISLFLIQACNFSQMDHICSSSFLSGVLPTFPSFLLICNLEYTGCVRKDLQLRMISQEERQVLL